MATVVTGSKVASFTAAMFAEITYFAVFSLYVKRIQSLGGRVTYDSLIEFVPFIVIVSTIPSVSAFVLISFINSYVFYFTIASSIGYFSVILLEVYCYYILYIKIIFMLEFRPKLQKILKIQVSLSLLIAMLGTTAMLILKFYYPLIGLAIHYCTMSLRITFLIDFYRYLINDIKTNDSDYNLMNMRNTLNY